ncbi:hypothetical protein [Streptomyces litmocidini]|nr:hypothetical protein [Streptomyces litmocidini]
MSVVPGTTLRETVEDVVTRAPGLGPSALSAGAVDRLRHEDDDLARK